ncbi:hydantoinase/oxoprolinase family protein [Nocardiopsis oceani]
MAVTTIDIDTGGTFTDGFVVRDGVAHTVKTLTTPHDLAVCFRNVMEAAAQTLGTTVRGMLRETASIRYATTVGTNTVIQRSGPRLGLIADGDVDVEQEKISLFVDPSMVAEVDQSEQSRLHAVRSLLGEGARGLVGSSQEGEVAGRRDAERSLAQLFAEHYPRHCLDSVPLLLSCEVTEDEDAARGRATALFNAYVHPDVADFLYRAEDYLRDQGYARPLRIVHNDGGAARVARTVAAKTYNSGPTAGLLGAQAVAEHYGIENMVTLDMGGTSLDLGVLERGAIPMHEHGLVAGVEISFALPALVPLGVGGGSIAWLDGSSVRVGPQSAGAQPGPACFGRGGESPTLTDADVVLGILRPESFRATGMQIQVDAARRAFEPMARASECTIEQIAQFVLDTVHTDAGRRLAAELADRDLGPGSVTALAFGGNGATHCASIAQAAGITDILILPFSPVFSAFGASTVDIRHRHQARAEEADEQALRRRVLRDMRGEGIKQEDVTLQTQEYEHEGARWIAVEGTHELPHLELGRGPDVTPGPEPTRTESATVHWPDYGPLTTTVIQRAGLAGLGTVEGPALVDSQDTTCAVPPEWTLSLDEHGAMRLTTVNARSK